MAYALRVVNQVKDIDLDDGVSFEVKDVSNIMDEMEYAALLFLNSFLYSILTFLSLMLHLFPYG